MKNVSSDFEQYGGSYLISDKNKAQFIDGQDYIGRPDGQFITTSNQIDDLLKNYPDNPREWERQLGLNEGSLGDGKVHRVDVYNPQDYEPRLPTSDLSGANDKFLEGQGKVPGGQDECVINQFPNPDSNPSVGKISEVYNGHSQTNTSNSEQKNDKLSSDKVAEGGGVRAPNGESGSAVTKSAERGTKPSQEDKSPANKGTSSERGQKPSSTTEGESQSKGVERGQKPSESESKHQGSNSTPRGEKPQEAPQNASNGATQRGTPPGSTGGEDSKVPTSFSNNPGDKISASSNSAKAADDASKVASDKAAQNVAPKPNGMEM